MSGMAKKKPKKFGEAMHTAVAVFPVGASPVEKHHLLGQETAEKKRRGRALLPRQVAAHSFRAAAVQAQRRRVASVEAAVFQKPQFQGITKARLVAFTKKCAIGARSALSSKGKGSAKKQVSLKPPPSLADLSVPLPPSREVGRASTCWFA